MRKSVLLAILMGLCCGCAVVNGGVEISKTLWGSSTRALEKARANALVKTYDKPFWDVVRAAEEYCDAHYVIFKKEEIKGYFVIMGIKGAVNTTEVGVFFVDINDKQTRIELSSLSTNIEEIPVIEGQKQ